MQHQSHKHHAGAALGNSVGMTPAQQLAAQIRALGPVDAADRAALRAAVAGVEIANPIRVALEPTRRSYKTHQVAEILRVDDRVILEQIHQGKLRATEIGGHGFRIRAEDLAQFIADSMVVPA